MFFYAIGFKSHTQNQTGLPHYKIIDRKNIGF